MTRLVVEFAKTSSGKDPVREWIRAMDKEDRKIIGQDIRNAQDNWPVGMPLCKNLQAGREFYELRTRSRRLRSLRIIFTLEGNRMILLNGFIKKQDAIPTEEIALSRKRLIQFRATT